MLPAVKLDRGPARDDASKHQQILAGFVFYVHETFHSCPTRSLFGPINELGILGKRLKIGVLFALSNGQSDAPI
jgi:hypothetical protein